MQCSSDEMRVGDQRRELGKIVVDEGHTPREGRTRGMARKQVPRVLCLYQNSTGRISDEHAVQLENECVRIPGTLESGASFRT